MPRSDLYIHFPWNPHQPLQNLRSWEVRILDYHFYDLSGKEIINDISRGGRDEPFVLEFRYKMPMKGLKLEFYRGPHLNCNETKGKYMYARLIKSDDDNYYEGSQTMSSSDIDAFTFQGYIKSPDISPDHFLVNQEKFHTFNRSFNSDGITIEDFEENDNNYVIQLMTNSVYTLALREIKDDTVHFLHSRPNCEWVTMAACTPTFTFPKTVKSVQIDRGWC